MAINGIEMITDRSLSDVEYAKTLLKKGLQNMTDEERQDFFDGLKGAYNYTDFNRVESAIEYLSDRLYNVPDELRDYANSVGVVWNTAYDVPYDRDDFENVEVKTDWSVSDILEIGDRERYIYNIYRILDALGIAKDQIPNDLQAFNHKAANYVEESLESSNNSLKQITDEKSRIILNTAKSWFFSGDLYGGEI